MHTTEPATPVSSVNTKETYLKEIQGFCTVAIENNRVKTRLMAAEEKGIITGLLMDELGIPLTVVSGTDSTLTLKSHFPPISKKSGTLFGLAAIAYMKSIQVDPLGNSIIKDLRRKQYPTYYYFTGNAPDSSIIHVGTKTHYSLHYGENSFSFLSEQRDTVCRCEWE